MVNCKIVWCPTNADELQRLLIDDLGPLLTAHWAIETKRTGVPHGLDVPAFMATWENKGIVLIMAYEGTEAIGFMMCYKFSPLFQRRSVLHLERWFCKDDATESAMFDYLTNIIPVIGVDQVTAVTHEGQKVPERVPHTDGYSVVEL